MTTTNKSPKILTATSWIKKANSSKLSASVFIAAHRNWLETGQYAEIASPILRMHDTEKADLLSNKLDTEAPACKYLELIKDAIFTHWHQSEIKAAENKMAVKDNSPSVSSNSKNWTAIVYNSKGDIQTRTTDSGEVQDMVKSFQMVNDADRWCDLRLVIDCTSDCYAVISHNHMMRADGDPISTVVMRQDALARIFKAKKRPFFVKTGVRDNSLSFSPKVGQTRMHFSHG